MTTSSKEAKFQALLKMIDLLTELESEESIIVVEGIRDVEALNRLGFKKQIEVCSKVGVSDSDLVEQLTQNNRSVVIFTDFDEEGRQLNKRLTKLFQRRGVKVMESSRWYARRLMAVLGVYTVEALDNRCLNILPDGFDPRKRNDELP